MTDQPEERPAGSWIGREPDENTEEVRRSLDEDDERVAVSDTESSGAGDAEGRVEGRDDEWPRGHREGEAADDDEVRRAGQSGR
jgi:hypothetical protein